MTNAWASYLNKDALYGIMVKEWKNKEIKLLILLRKKHKETKEISKMLNRTENSIRLKISRLGNAGLTM